MSGRGFFGFLLIILGLGFILNLYEVLDFGKWWPMIIILIGIYQIIRNRALVISGLILTAIGVFIMAKKLGFVSGEIIFPSILILIGISLIFNRIKIRPVHGNDENYLNYFILFSGMENKLQSAEFKGGNVSAVFGGATIDLRDAVLSENGASLELTAIFGGIDLYVPDDWMVYVTGIPLFGGWDNKTKLKSNDTSQKRILRVNCVAMFGGVDIKN